MNPPQPREARWPPEPEEVPGSWAEIVGKHGESRARRAHRKVSHGFYLPKHLEVTRQSRAIASARSHRGGVISGATAARAHRHPWPAAGLPEIIVARRSNSHSRHGDLGADDIRLISRNLARPPETVPAGDVKLLIAAPVDTTIDCVAALPDDEAVAFLDGALRTWDIGRDLHQWAHQSRKHGCRRMRDLLPRTDARAESRPESILRYRLNSAGYHGWVPQFPVTAGNVGHFIDLADPYHRIALEFHGAGHWDDPPPTASRRRTRQPAAPSRLVPHRSHRLRPVGQLPPHPAEHRRSAPNHRGRVGCGPHHPAVQVAMKRDWLGGAVRRIRRGPNRAGRGSNRAGQGPYRTGRGSNRTDWAGKPGER